MHDDVRQVYRRIDRFMAERLAPAIYRDARPLDLHVWEAPGEPVPFAEAVRQQYRPIRPGTLWGRPWGTSWFRATGTVPQDWVPGRGLEVEATVDLGFTGTAPGFQTEGLVYRADGTVLKGVEPLNRAVPLDLGPGARVDLLIEAASNPDLTQGWQFRPTPKGDPATAGSDPLYRLGEIRMALLDRTVWELAQDFWTLHGLLHELPQDLPRRAEITRALERAIDAIDPHDVAATAQEGRRILAPVLASPAYASAHRVHAVGHAHIDSAWLWPVRETVRKVARTFSNALDLMDRNPEFVFAASSAQQYAWLKEHYPALYERVRTRVAEGRFVPVGGMWVEADTNLPGGEALARQFVAGKRFFLEEFGHEPLEAWLPDSFGYSAALPQIVAAAGSCWFLTQKISWNETNIMPHHTFRWSGIDGTEIFTHFPPVDTYSSELSGRELARAQRQYREKGAANTSLVPFGWGDGGGGPTREMLAAAQRTKDLEGSPAVRLSSPRAFFEAAQSEYPQAPVWSGELYLEFHRGTYTSQARTKQGNRRSEHLLREAELWAATALVRGVADYPYDELEAAWRTVLLLQFHDILPGSSIAWVHDEAEAAYGNVARTLEARIDASLRSLVGTGAGTAVLNAGPYAVEGVPALGGGVPAPQPRVTAREAGGHFILGNEYLEIEVDANGLIVSLLDRRADRQLLAPGGAANLLQLCRDTPNQWDAWDLDEHYRRNVHELRAADSVNLKTGDGKASLLVTRTFGSSRIEETITVGGGHPAVELDYAIDWHERQKLLKLAVAADIHAERAASEIQFGHIHRPTHANTSWDAARFETAAHRWVHIGEAGYGLAVANSASYGHDIARAGRNDGGTTTQVRVSLLRAPLYPDPQADQGHNSMRLSLLAGAGIPEAVAEGYRMNLPLRRVPDAAETTLEPLLRVDNPAVVVEAVKAAEDRSGDIVVRLYEAHGGRARAVLTLGFGVAQVLETDLLERPYPNSRCSLVHEDDEVRMQLRPFQLVTLRLRRR